MSYQFLISFFTNFNIAAVSYFKIIQEKFVVDEVSRLRNSQITEEKKVQDILNTVDQSNNLETLIEVLKQNLGKYLIKIHIYLTNHSFTVIDTQVSSRKFRRGIQSAFRD